MPHLAAAHVWMVAHWWAVRLEKLVAKMKKRIAKLVARVGELEQKGE